MLLGSSEYGGTQWHGTSTTVVLNSACIVRTAHGDFPTALQFYARGRDQDDMRARTNGETILTGTPLFRAGGEHMSRTSAVPDWCYGYDGNVRAQQPALLGCCYTLPIIFSTAEVNWGTNFYRDDNQVVIIAISPFLPLVFIWRIIFNDRSPSTADIYNRFVLQMAEEPSSMVDECRALLAGYLRGLSHVPDRWYPVIQDIIITLHHFSDSTIMFGIFRCFLSVGW